MYRCIYSARHTKNRVFFGLFKDAFTISDDIASNDMIREYLKGFVRKRSCSKRDAIQKFACMTRENHEGFKSG
jgi:hypothetical protein